MKIARRVIQSPFVLEKSKLTRLLEVTDAKFKQNDYKLDKQFIARASGDRVTQTDKLEIILAMDNSARHRIQQLTVFTSATPPDSPQEARPERYQSIEFDGTSRASIEVVVRGEDETWANETFSAAEEQVERTVQSTLIHRLSSGRYSPYMLLAGALGLLLGMLTMLTLDQRNPLSRSRLADAMWLTPTDLAELQPLQNDPSKAQARAGEILSRQLHNLSERNQNQPNLAKLLHWKPLLMMAPFAIILTALAYLYLRCYPRAVFLWGDAEDWYRGILNKRKFVWTTIVAALVLGIVLDLFALAITPH